MKLLTRYQRQSLLNPEPHDQDSGLNTTSLAKSHLNSALVVLSIISG